MTILIGTPSSIPTPPAGEATLFINTDDNDILSYKLPDGTVKRYSANDVAECCSCEIAKSMTEAVNCALAKGTITMAEYMTFVNTGLTIETVESTDADGNTTCTVNVGPKVANIDPTALGIIPSTSSVSATGTLQFYPDFTPRNASNQDVVWTSSDPSKATIDADGLVTGVASGTTTIRVYSVEDVAIIGERALTVV